MFNTKGKAVQDSDLNRGQKTNPQRRFTHDIGSTSQPSKGAPPPHWPLWVALASAFGLLLGVTTISLSVLSVSISTQRLAVPQKPAAQSTQPRTTVAPTTPPTFYTIAPTITPSGASPNTPAPIVASKTPTEVLERRTKGHPNAPIAIDEWFDFQCPACRYVGTKIEPELAQRYVEAGKVRFIYHNAPILGPESVAAAEAAACAADQGHY